MKQIKLLFLLSTLLLVGCGGNKKPTSSYIGESSYSFVNSDTSESEYSTISSLESSSSEQLSSSEIVSSSEISSSKHVRSSLEIPEITATVSFVNPSCGSFSTEVLNERLASYINTSIGYKLVSSIENYKCQISNNIPTDGMKVLIIGSAKETGYLDFSFAKTVKKVEITAETYYKPYIDVATGMEIANVDHNSQCMVTTNKKTFVSTIIDLTPVYERPVEKKVSLNIDSDEFKLSTINDLAGRVFIKEISFTF